MKIGYARVSTKEQNLDVQLQQLREQGCEYIYADKESGKTTERPQLLKMLAHISDKTRRVHVMAEGPHAYQTVVVTKLDRLARSTRDLLELLERIGNAGASFYSLAEPWADTTSPAGKLIMTVFAGVAQFERERMLERCNEGRTRAKRDGVKFGRPSALTGHQQREALQRLKSGEELKSVARSYNVNRSTIVRLKQRAALP